MEKLKTDARELSVKAAVAFAAALLALLVAQLGYGARSDGVTIDEIVYINAGFRHLFEGDFRLNPEQPPFAKVWAAAGLLGMGLVRSPDPDTVGDEWGSAFRFVHRDTLGQPVVGRARAAAIVLTVLLVIVVGLWAKGVGGRSAALWAMALLVFHPSILAHGHLVTTDAPAAFTMVLASWAFWRWWRFATPWAALFLGATIGLAVATRLTGWLLLPVFAALFVILPLLGSTEPRPTARGAFRAAAFTGALSLAFLWGAYGFRYAPWPGETIAKPVAESLGLGGRIVSLCLRYHALPEAYLEGTRFVLEHNAGGHPTYLLGAIDTKGWPHYYLVAVLAKSPLPFLIAVGLGLYGVLRKGRAMWGSFALHALLPAAALFALVSLGRIQIGERYVLPVYPYFALVAGVGLASLRLRRSAVVGLVAAQAVVALLAAPRGYLTFFNVVAGGAGGGHKVLLDSNIDWGQDLPRLAAWMRGNGVDRVTLAYHGCDDPDRYGIAHDDLPGAHLYPVARDTRELRGVVAVSPNLLYGLFDPPGTPRYAALLARQPDARAGALFIYRLGEPGLGSTPF